jgi:HEPN domain-containing protein
MKPLTAEWVDKAEQDFGVATTLRRQGKDRFAEPVCFHCQQCAEKYLKARLQEAAIEFPKTHDLLRLLQLVAAVEPFWTTHRDALKRLTEYAIELRYPGDHATAAEAQQALMDCRVIRQAARQSLGLHRPPQPPLSVREKRTLYRTRKRKK